MVGSLSIYAFILILTITRPVKCSDEQAFFRRSVQKYLENHVIKTTHAETELECSMYCLTNTSCASVNYKISGISKGLCELNNRTLQLTSDVAGAMTYNPEFNHLYIIEKVSERFEINSVGSIFKERGLRYRTEKILKRNFEKELKKPLIINPTLQRNVTAGIRTWKRPHDARNIAPYSTLELSKLAENLPFKNVFNLVEEKY